MLPEVVTTDVTNDDRGILFLRVEIIHKIMVQERGDRGIEFDRCNHPQIDSSRETATLKEDTRGYSSYEQNLS